MNSPVNAAGWRAFRLLLLEINDGELARLTEDANRERIARIERDAGLGRLFFSALNDLEIEAARRLLHLEQLNRAQDRRAITSLGKIHA